jgi:protein gp37
MAANSAIEWTDATWNPTRGCSMVSEGCANCYAMKVAHRFRGPGLPYEGLTSALSGKWNGKVALVHDMLGEPLRWRKPRRIFVDSMSDLFHEKVPFEFIDKVFAVMAACPQHTFQILTKRPERMAKFYNRKSIPLDAFCDALNAVAKAKPGTTGKGFNVDGSWRLDHVWIGTSVENQAAAEERIPHLLRCPAAVRFLSCEPLLEAVDLRQWLGSVLPSVHCQSNDCIDGVGLVISGGESGKGARPAHLNWFRDLRDQCEAAGVAYFFKQHGEWAAQDVSSGPIIVSGNGSKLRVIGIDGKEASPQNGPYCLTAKVGKKAAGRLLDGVTHDAMPAKT